MQKLFWLLFSATLVKIGPLLVLASGHTERTRKRTFGTEKNSENKNIEVLRNGDFRSLVPTVAPT